MVSSEAFHLHYCPAFIGLLGSFLFLLLIKFQNLHLLPFLGLLKGNIIFCKKEEEKALLFEGLFSSQTRGCFGNATKHIEKKRGKEDQIEIARST